MVIIHALTVHYLLEDVIGMIGGLCFGGEDSLVARVMVARVKPFITPRRPVYISEPSCDKENGGPMNLAIPGLFSSTAPHSQNWVHTPRPRLRALEALGKDHQGSV